MAPKTRKPRPHPIRHEMASDEERPPLTTPLEKLCYLIVKAREYDVQVPADDGESGSNPSDDMEVSILEESPESDPEEELRDALEGLNDDEKVELLALTWLGRGDYEAGEWDTALAEARDIHDQRETGYLLGIPQLGDLIEEGLSLLGYSCEDFEIGRL